MQNYTAEEFAALLTRTFARYQPRVVYDVDDKGQRLLEFILPNPDFPRFSVSLQTTEIRKQVDRCTLWMGQAQITSTMDPELAIPAIEEIISDRVVAILRYKNEDAYDNHHPADKAQWLYQLTEDEDDDSKTLERMKQKLITPPSFGEKLSGKMTGVFEIIRWSGNEIIRR